MFRSFPELSWYSSPDQIPNCLKVVIILEELGLPYESKWVELQDFKQEPYHSANPCGNVPGMNLVLDIFHAAGVCLHGNFSYDPASYVVYNNFDPQPSMISTRMSSSLGPAPSWATWSVLTTTLSAWPSPRPPLSSIRSRSGLTFKPHAKAPTSTN